MEKKIKIEPIGKIHKDDRCIFIEISENYEEALLGLDGFSHIYVLYWFHENDTPGNRATLRVHPRYTSENPLTGVFACCAPMRPNLIGLTICKINSVSKNRIYIQDIDALDTSPVLDIKPYFPKEDLIDIRIPDWANKDNHHKDTENTEKRKGKK